MPKEIGALEAKGLLEAKKAVLLDVREKEEVDFSPLGHDYWIPMQEIPQRSNELPKNKKILVACRTGGRSAGVAEYLTRQGFDCANLRGGVFEWHDKVDNSVPKYVYGYADGKLKVKKI
ncbi:MAG: rhodanese-like domain-containing protein [archaeon]|nr:rhodanese-like domain-containing protein [archaeon]